MSTAPPRERTGLATAIDLARLEVRSAARAGVFNPTFFIQPVIFLLIIAIGIVAPKLEEAKASERVTDVAVLVETDAGEAPKDLVARLRAAPPPRLAFRDEADPVAVVGAERAEAGLLVGRDGVRAVSLPSVAASRLGLTRLRDALADAEVRRAAEAGAAVSAIATDDVDLQKTSRGRRLALGDIVPVYLLVQLLQVAVSALTSIRGDKESRSIEGLLTLPAPRWSLLAGKAAGVLFEGFLRMAVLVAVIAAATRTSIGGVRLEIALSSLVAMVVCGLAIVAAFIGAGTAIGVAARSSAQEGAASGALSLGAVGAGLALGQLKVAGGSALVRCIPIVGPVVSIRGVIYDAVGPLDVALSCAASVAFAVAMVALGARLLRRDGLTLRDS